MPRFLRNGFVVWCMIYVQSVSFTISTPFVVPNRAVFVGRPSTFHHHSPRRYEPARHNPYYTDYVVHYAQQNYRVVPTAQTNHFIRPLQKPQIRQLLNNTLKLIVKKALQRLAPANQRHVIKNFSNANFESSIAAKLANNNSMQTLLKNNTNVEETLANKNKPIKLSTTTPLSVESSLLHSTKPYTKTSIKTTLKPKTQHGEEQRKKAVKFVESREWYMEEPKADTTSTSYENEVKATTISDTTLYQSSPIVVLDSTKNNELVHDVLIVRNRKKNPGLHSFNDNHSLWMPTSSSRRRPVWSGLVTPVAFNVENPIVINNHRPPSIVKPSSIFDGTDEFFPPEIKRRKTSRRPERTTPPFSSTTVDARPLHVFDTIANTTIVHNNIITIAKPTVPYNDDDFTSTQTESMNQVIADDSTSTEATSSASSSGIIADDEDFLDSTVGATATTTTTRHPSTTTLAHRPSTSWSFPSRPSSSEVSTTRPSATAASSISLPSRPIYQLPLWVKILDNITRYARIPAMLNIFQNIGSYVLALPSAVTAVAIMAFLLI